MAVWRINLVVGRTVDSRSNPPSMAFDVPAPPPLGMWVDLGFCGLSLRSESALPPSLFCRDSGLTKIETTKFMHTKN